MIRKHHNHKLQPTLFNKTFLECTLSNEQQNIEQLQTLTMGVTLTTTEPLP